MRKMVQKHADALDPGATTRRCRAEKTDIEWRWEALEKGATADPDADEGGLAEPSDARTKVSPGDLTLLAPVESFHMISIPHCMFHGPVVDCLALVPLHVTP